MSSLHSVIKHVLSNLPETLEVEVKLDNHFHRRLEAIQATEPVTIGDCTVPFGYEDPKFAIARMLTNIKDDIGDKRLSSAEVKTHIENHCPKLLDQIQLHLIDQARKINWDVADYLTQRGFDTAYDKREECLSICLGRNALKL